MADIRVKRGAALTLNFGFGNPDGTPFDIQNVLLTLTVADPRGNLLASTGLQPTGVAGQAAVTIQSTATWPEGLVQADLLITVNGTSIISQSFGIRVERPVVQLAPDPAAYNPVTAP
ncbi:MAG: hypothetical protein B7Z57_11600 [Acidiphilium sp. 37-60-79]|nr:MAG: hypothetical protein B7Z57_11600 [Acidiphilium sp. 37-60-79]OZB40858.1 MAG: hypothetical protein B7X48_03265 [Acidiphilium sp. 34-60-192]